MTPADLKASFGITPEREAEIIARHSDGKPVEMRIPKLNPVISEHASEFERLLVEMMRRSYEYYGVKQPA